MEGNEGGWGGVRVRRERGREADNQKLSSPRDLAVAEAESVAVWLRLRVDLREWI